MADFASFQNKSYDSLDEGEKVKYTNTMNAVVSVRDGAFGQHTGFAPLFKSGDNLKLDDSRESNIEYNGHGEIGSIMLDFQWNSMMQSKGFGELAKPMYDQRMWDDRGCAIKAPTVRLVTDIALTIVAKVSGMEYIAYLDDLVFATVDLAGGYKTPEEVGKQLAIKAVCWGVGEAGKAGALALGGVLTGGSKVLGDIGLAGAQAATNATAGAFINNVNLSKLGTSDWFNGEGFANTMTSMDTWASTASAMVGAGVTGGLGLVNLQDGNGNFLSGDLYDRASIYSFNSTLGGIASTGVTYGMTGNASVNVLNLSMFGGPDVGLFELGFGKDGFSGALSMGGTDMNALKLINSINGINETANILSFKTNGKEGNDTLSAFNGLAITGDKTNIELAKKIKDREIKVAYGDMGTKYGKFDEATPDTIFINNDLLGGGEEGAAQIASLLAHEGLHAGGNYAEDKAYQSGWDTFNTLRAAWKVTGDGYTRTGIETMSRYYGEHGIDNALFVLDSQGLLDNGQGGVHSQDASVDPMLTALYGYVDSNGKVKVDPRILESERIRAKARDYTFLDPEKHFLKRDEFETYLDGLGVKLGLDSDILSSVIKTQMQAKDEYNQMLSKLDGMDKKTQQKLKDMGVDLTKGGIEQWAGAIAYMLLENGFAKRTADYAAGKVVDESIGVPGAWGMIKSTTAKQAFEEYLKGSSEDMVTKMYKKVNGKIPGADDIKYAITEIAISMAWGASVLSKVSELNGIRDYREHLQAQGSFTDDMRMETSMQNIASIDYLEQLVTSGTLMDMVESYNTHYYDTLHNGAWCPSAYSPFLDLGNWDNELTGLPYTLEDSLSDWTSVQANYTHSNQYSVEPNGVLKEYLQVYNFYSKTSQKQSKFSWKWR
jgi:hypothetical protein